MQRRSAMIASLLHSVIGNSCSSLRVHHASDLAARRTAEVVKQFGVAPTRIGGVKRLHALQRTDGGCAVPRISGGQATAILLERF